MAAGEEWYNALSGAGNDIANAMIMYHREHQAYDQQLGVANALSRIGVNSEGRIVPIVPDADGKVDKSLKPVVDPKALEMFQTGNRRDWARSAGALDAISRLGMSYVNRASEQNIEPKYPVNTGDRVIPATAGQAIQADLEGQRIDVAQQAGKVREARALRGERRQDVHLGLAIGADQRAAEAAQRSELEKRPEIEFSRKYGFTPQAMIGLQESPYLAMNEKGAVIGENEPLGPGERVKDYSNKPGWMKELITLGFAAPTNVQWQAKDPANGVFRESKLDYAGSAKAGTPKREVFRTNPEGELLNVRGTRIPIEEVNRVQNAATAAQKDLQNTLSSPTFQAFKPEKKAAALLQVKDRLSRLGYNPNDPFWGLPQQ